MPTLVKIIGGLALVALLVIGGCTGLAWFVGSNVIFSDGETLFELLTQVNPKYKAKHEAYDAKRRAETYEHRVYLVSQQIIKRQLPTPSTAKFPDFYRDRMTKVTIDSLYYGPGVYVEVIPIDRKADHFEYKIRSDVDFQNKYGAIVRQRYICTIKRIGDDFTSEYGCRFMWDLDE